MRVSKPGGRRVERRNSKSNLQMELTEDKKQPRNPHHDPNYEPQYGCSRKTGRKAGGYYYNPPAFCESPRIEVDDKGDCWVQVYFCKTKPCPRYTSGTCPIRNLPKTEYVDGHPVFDEPDTRKPKRVERHVAARELREQVKPRRVSAPVEEAPRRRRMS